MRLTPDQIRQARTGARVVFTWLRHNLGVITLAFAAWTAGASIATYRERATLLPEIERAYLDGLRDAGGAVESCRDRPDLCGDKDTSRIPDTTRRSASR